MNAFETQAMTEAEAMAALGIWLNHQRAGGCVQRVLLGPVRDLIMNR